MKRSGHFFRPFRTVFLYFDWVVNSMNIRSAMSRIGSLVVRAGAIVPKEVGVAWVHDTISFV